MYVPELWNADMIVVSALNVTVCVTSPGSHTHVRSSQQARSAARREDYSATFTESGPAPPAPPHSMPPPPAPGLPGVTLNHP